MKVYKIMWWVVFLTTSIECSKGECADRFPNTKCMPIEECKALRTIFLKSDQTLDDSIFLINRNCGNRGRKYTKICCPKYIKCVTPAGVKGQCINATDCASADSLKLTRSGCEGYNHVCCPFPPLSRVVEQEPVQEATPPATIVDSRCPAKDSPPDPKSDCCESYGDFNKITGGDAAEIDQFPWLALIEYDSGHPGKPDTICGGALISASFVLTAAHCVVDRFANRTGVRLGEYNTVVSGPDCVLTVGGGTDCTDGAVSIPVRRTIVHELYPGADNRSRWHDIAVIQLERPVKFTSFITPICLASTNISANPPTDRLIVAGWGSTRTDSEKSPSFINLFVELPYVNFNTCAADYSRLNNQSLWHGQICAGGEPGKDSCKGDSGGPLMYFKDGRVHMVGIVSYGAFPCGGDSLPGVYTSVIEYLDWIRNAIRSISELQT